jgi:hypothetical protein
MRTYLIVPAETDLATQCRIVSSATVAGDALAAYRADPHAWQYSGLMNSQGKLVCLDDAALFARMREDEPLAAGLVYRA